MAEWRRLLRASTTQGRTVIQRIIRGRITFHPWTNPISGELDGYEFEASNRFDRLFTGLAVERPKELEACQIAGIGPEDPFDGHSGRVLAGCTLRPTPRLPLKGSYVFFVGWVHIFPQARQLNHWIVPTASPPSRSLLPQLLQNCCGDGRRAGCGAEVFGESIRRSDYAGQLSIERRAVVDSRFTAQLRRRWLQIPLGGQLQE